MRFGSTWIVGGTGLLAIAFAAAQSDIPKNFVAPTAALKAEVARSESFVRDQLGDARSFSLDSPETRRPRIAALRAAKR